MKLLQELKKKPFCNDFHLILIPILLLIISLKYYFFIIFLLIYLIFIMKRTKLLFPITLLSIIILSIYFIKLSIRNNYKPKVLNAYVYDVINDHSYIIKSNIITIRINDYNNQYKPGDYINIELEYYDTKKSYENDFDMNEYIYSNNIDYYAKAIKSNYKYKLPSLKLLKYNYLNYLEKNLSDKSFNYVSKLVFNMNTDNEISDCYSTLGISHILAISGLHIMILYKIISFIILKLFHITSDKIPLILIILYSLFVGFSPSIFRAILFLILSSFNNRSKYKYTRLDILSISMIFMLILNPLEIYSIGFILSFLVSFVLIFMSDLIEEKNKIKRLYKSYLLIYLITLPFCIKITNRISIISLLLSPILSISLGYILIPLSYILSILPILDYVLKYIYIFIDFYIINISKISPIINVKTFNIFKLLIYYFIFSILLYTLASKKKIRIPIILYTSFFIIILGFKYVNPITNITFIDCGQGDSSLIRLPFNQGVMLIDCYNSYDFLKTEGISKIDYLVLTHSDNDHIGDYKEILENIKVDKIIYSKYDLLFDELLSNYDNKIGVDNKYTIQLSYLKIDVLGPINSYSDPNSNSIVLRFEINKHVLLYTGDMTEKEEIDLVNEYKDYLKCDILKVAHHGSNTSSTDIFLSYAKPKYSIISVSEYNNYNLPSNEVINRLKKYSKIYQTKYCGNIDIKFFFNNLFIQTFR